MGYWSQFERCQNDIVYIYIYICDHRTYSKEIVESKTLLVAGQIIDRRIFSRNPLLNLASSILKGNSRIN